MTEPKFVDRSKVEEDVHLEYPIEHDGVVYEKITVRTPNMKALKAWNKSVLEAQADGRDLSDIRLPLYDAPEVVLDHLHPDDDDRLQETGGRFLPRRFRDDQQASASPPSSAA